MKSALFTISLFLISVISLAQVELAVQKGHSDEIVLMEFSGTGKYLASLGANNEIIIWEMAHEKSMSSVVLPDREKIIGMRFSADEWELQIKSERTTFFYNFRKSSLREEFIEGDTLYRKKDYWLDAGTNHEVWIREGAIRKKQIGKRFKKYEVAVNYLNAPFTAFDVSPKKNLLVGVAEDQHIYVYNYTSGKKKKVLKGHNSGINEIRFSLSGNYFATAGQDRSIAIWNTETLELETRLFSNVYRKKTATFSESGKQIFVGDELGYIYEIDLQTAFPKVKVGRPNYHSVNRIVWHEGANRVGYYIATSNNMVYFKHHPLNQKSESRYVFRPHRIMKMKKIVLQSLVRTYQHPYGEVTALDISPNGEALVFTGNADIPNITFTSTGGGTEKHLYDIGSWEQWTDVAFCSDSTFVGIKDSSNVLYCWLKDKRKYYVKTDTLPFMVRDIENLGDGKLWLNSFKFGQFEYDLNTRNLKETSNAEGFRSFKRGNWVFVATVENRIEAYDLINKEEYCIFSGHTNNVTDINIHPDQDLVVSSSDDGTIRLWSLKNKKALSTIIPFYNEEFVFITPDNYYLITKGAMDEIGFKHDGQYFFPEQFDLKFNRPDIVLNRMGFTDSLLIGAYHQAYLKRLRKMNFKEEDLSGDFHLPEVDIKNILEIPDQTNQDKIDLQLKLSDRLYPLDRINIWVNDVAVFGAQGYSLRNKETKIYEATHTVQLARGKNKIQVSVLNQNGAESYKKTVEIESSAGKEIPDLYIVALGVSQHQQSEYNLEFAKKDALDLCKTFELSPYFSKVHSKTVTNDEVKLENLEEIKPFFMNADINDVVVLFIAGHGVLDDNFDYYFASYDMDFQDPASRGIPYDRIENLLDGIRALRKLLFIDTCHSGELDEEDLQEAEEGEEGEEGDLKFRGVGKNVKYKDTPLGLKSTNELMKSLFTDLRRGTGATVISSSGGTEYSIEGGEFKNGLFTYCMLTGLKSRKADLNRDKIITVRELQIYVREQVSQLSSGRQTPTSRIQNNELDYRIW